MQQTDFATAFANIVVEDKERRALRMALHSAMYGTSETDARIIDEAVCTGVRESFRVIGASLDALSARIQPDAMPMMLDFFAKNAEALNEYVIGVVFDTVKPTSGCDCESCKLVKAMRAPLSLSAKNAEAAGGVR